MSTLWPTSEVSTPASAAKMSCGTPAAVPADTTGSFWRSCAHNLGNGAFCTILISTSPQKSARRLALSRRGPAPLQQTPPTPPAASGTAAAAPPAAGFPARAAGTPPAAWPPEPAASKKKRQLSSCPVNQQRRLLQSAPLKDAGHSATNAAGELWLTWACCTHGWRFQHLLLHATSTPAE